MTKPLVIGSFYRPPDSKATLLTNFRQNLEEIHKSQKQAKSTYIIGGDMNFTCIDWENISVVQGPDKSQCDTFLEILRDFGLSQHVFEITRPVSKKILDLIMCSDPNSVHSAHSLPGMSDHNIVAAEFNFSTKFTKKPQRPVFKYNKADWASIRNKARNLNTGYFSRNPDEKTVSENCTYIENGILNIIKTGVPSKMSSSKPSVPWINRNIKQHQNKRDRAYRTAVKHKDPSDWNEFKDIRRTTKTLIRNSKKDYVQNNIGNSLVENPKTFWSFIKTS